jgi:hypothetical protein
MSAATPYLLRFLVGVNSGRLDLLMSGEPHGPQTSR